MWQVLLSGGTKSPSHQQHLRVPTAAQMIYLLRKPREGGGFKKHPLLPSVSPCLTQVFQVGFPGEPDSQSASWEEGASLALGTTVRLCSQRDYEMPQRHQGQPWVEVPERRTSYCRLRVCLSTLGLTVTMLILDLSAIKYVWLLSPSSSRPLGPLQSFPSLSSPCQNSQPGQVFCTSLSFTLHSLKKALKRPRLALWL